MNLATVVYGVCITIALISFVIGLTAGRLTCDNAPHRQPAADRVLSADQNGKRP